MLVTAAHHSFAKRNSKKIATVHAQDRDQPHTRIPAADGNLPPLRAHHPCFAFLFLESEGICTTSGRALWLGMEHSRQKMCYTVQYSLIAPFCAMESTKKRLPLGSYECPKF
eukprot:3953217-Amphidinium_carterae.1